MTGTVRVLIADDHPVVRDGLSTMLDTQADLDVAGQAEDGAEAVALAARLRPDVVLMDLQMPRMDGVAAMLAIREDAPGARVIVLTTYDTDGDITRAIEAGATGYLLKDCGRQQLFAAIRAAARGESVLSPQVTRRVLSRMRSPSEQALSGREIEVLMAVARGLNNRAIAASLHISQATVKTHLLHIFTKLEVDDRTAAVTRALERDIIRLPRE